MYYMMFSWNKVFITCTINTWGHVSSVIHFLEWKSSVFLLLCTIITYIMHYIMHYPLDAAHSECRSLVLPCLVILHLHLLGYPLDPVHGVHRSSVLSCPWLSLVWTISPQQSVTPVNTPVSTSANAQIYIPANTPVNTLVKTTVNHFQSTVECWLEY